MEVGFNLIVGFYTAVFREWSLEKLLEWATKNGFKALEVYAGPKSKHIDPEEVTKGKAMKLKRAFEEKDLYISSLAYYPNNLDPNEEKRRANINHIKIMIDAASQLDVNIICTFIGSNGNFFCTGIETSLKLFKEVFPEIIDHAKDHDIRIAIENCPLGGWNIAFSPEIWDEIFSIGTNIGLNFDPSHLVWQGIDYVKAIYDYGKRIFHTHAKDTEVFKGKLRRSGIYGKGWWRYRVPGWGEIDWRKVITALKDVGYDYVLSIEMEDPLFKPEEGLILGLRYLSSLLL